MKQPNAGAQQLILTMCDAMKIEDHRLIAYDMIRDAWPPTGAADDSPVMGGIASAGEMRSLALALGGNKPDLGKTSIEVMRTRLGQKFRVRDRPEELAVEVHRVR